MCITGTIYLIYLFNFLVSFFFLVHLNLVFVCPYWIKINLARPANIPVWRCCTEGLGCDNQTQQDRVWCLRYSGLYGKGTLAPENVVKDPHGRLRRNSVTLKKVSDILLIGLPVV